MHNILSDTFLDFSSREIVILNDGAQFKRKFQKSAHEENVMTWETFHWRFCFKWRLAETSAFSLNITSFSRHFARVFPTRIYEWCHRILHLSLQGPSSFSTAATLSTSFFAVLTANVWPPFPTVSSSPCMEKSYQQAWMVPFNFVRCLALFRSF